MLCTDDLFQFSFAVTVDSIVFHLLFPGVLLLHVVIVLVQKRLIDLSYKMITTGLETRMK